MPPYSTPFTTFYFFHVASIFLHKCSVLLRLASEPVSRGRECSLIDGAGELNLCKNWKHPFCLRAAHCCSNGKLLFLVGSYLERGVKGRAPLYHVCIAGDILTLLPWRYRSEDNHRKCAGSFFLLALIARVLFEPGYPQAFPLPSARFFCHNGHFRSADLDVGG